MIGLDTNVLVRYLAQDDPNQTRAATELIEKNCTENNPAFINHVVLCETIWVLQKCYHVDKVLIVEILGKILSTEQFEIHKIHIVWRAFQEFQQRGKIDFADCLLSQVNKDNGCKGTYTFDKAAAATDGFNLL